jgi:putative spermidine/putrescine transport system permease protein
MAASNASTSQPLLTADGTPLKTSLQRSMRRSKLRAAMLVLPPLVFLLTLFIFPIGNLLTRSTDDALINHQLPVTFAILDQWDRQQLPDERLFEAMFLDLTSLNRYLIKDNFASAVNPNDPAWKIQIPKKGPYRDAMIAIAPHWKDEKTWSPIF